MTCPVRSVTYCHPDRCYPGSGLQQLAVTGVFVSTAWMHRVKYTVLAKGEKDLPRSVLVWLDAGQVIPRIRVASRAEIARP